jgi:hypothetical protein
MKDAFSPAHSSSKSSVPRTRYGFCQGCGKRFLIRNSDGMIRKHVDDEYAWRDCDGSKEAPVKVSIKKVLSWSPERRSN